MDPLAKAPQQVGQQFSFEIVEQTTEPIVATVDEPVAIAIAIAITIAIAIVCAPAIVLAVVFELLLALLLVSEVIVHSWCICFSRAPC